METLNVNAEIVAEALAVADAILTHYKGFIRAAMADRGYADSDDVAQNLRMMAVELPEALTAAGPAAHLELVRKAIPGGRHHDVQVLDGTRRHPTAAPMADRFYGQTPTRRAEIVAAVHAKYGSVGKCADLDGVRKLVGKMVRCPIAAVDHPAKSTPIDYDGWNADLDAEINGRTHTAVGRATPTDSTATGAAGARTIPTGWAIERRIVARVGQSTRATRTTRHG